MKIDALQVGPLQTNCYIAYDDTGCVVFDPGYSADAIVQVLGERKLDLIVLTHGHMDHIGGLPELARATGASIAAFEGEVERIENPERGMFDSAYAGYEPVSRVDLQLRDGETFKVGDMEFEAIHTPGHTEGSMCVYAREAGVLFSGDTLFRGTCGRTDFKGGDPAAMRESLLKLMKLPDATAVLPGHNNPTVIADERRWIERQTQ